MRLRMVAATVTAVAMTAALGPTGRATPGLTRPTYVGFQGETGWPADYDRRTGRVAPSAEQRALVEELGGTVRWNRFGTPHSLIDHRGHLDEVAAGDPSVAARRWIADHRALFRLSEDAVDHLELLSVNPIGDDGHAVLFRQTVDGIPAAPDGLITLGIARGKLFYVSSSAAGDQRLVGGVSLSPVDAWGIAAADLGIDAGRPERVGNERGWTVFDVPGVSEPARARLRVVPTPRDGVRVAYETLLIDNDHRHGHPVAFTHFVDAEAGDVLLRESRLQFEEPPAWSVFPAYPPLTFRSKDVRQAWCWRGGEGCARAVRNNAALAPWDVDLRTGQPTFTTAGNAAISGQAWLSPFTPAENYRPVSPTRTYSFPWQNQWFESNCDPSALTSPNRNDIDPATANLFAMHNRMHDWSYQLGFTESAWNLQQVNREDSESGEDNDPEVGNAQAGALVGTASPLVGRDNANQITPPDGISPITNMYLWQPIAAAFYPPCTDGDFDMSVIAHEYTHAISNRMVAGPDQGLSGPQAGAMGESYSDLFAVEILNAYGLVPVTNENPYSVGPYVTGDFDTAVRNYGMNMSPLNYSNIAYDFVGQQVHADGEIWSAINFGIRSALSRRYDAQFPSDGRSLQQRCAEGKLPATRCPGSRRWVQIVFNAFLLMPSRSSFIDARDAYLAADKMRFKGANQDTLWDEFARGGLGKGAKSNGNTDADPRPSFVSPRSSSGTVTFEPIGRGGARPRGVKIYVGHYEARSVPIADKPRDTVRMVPGTYDFLAQAEGFGMVRFTKTIRPGEQTVMVPMSENLASKSNGAKATGDGDDINFLIDDTEATNWESDRSAGTGSAPGDVKGRQVTVDLAGGAHVVDRVNVSAMLNDSGGQNRFSALRRFRIDVCDARGPGGCKKPGDFKTAYISPKNAFPAVPPRPKAPHLILRSFDIPDVVATHVRFVVLSNQCTGVKAFHRDTDADPTNDGSCESGLHFVVVPPQSEIVRAAELQVFGR